MRWPKQEKFGLELIRYKDELKQARNNYNLVIRKIKRVCWQRFLQGQNTI